MKEDMKLKAKLEMLKELNKLSKKMIASDCESMEDEDGMLLMQQKSNPLTDAESEIEEQDEEGHDVSSAKDLSDEDKPGEDDDSEGLKAKLAMMEEKLKGKKSY